jgi:hypothetical protein
MTEGAINRRDFSYSSFAALAASLACGASARAAGAAATRRERGEVTRGTELPNAIALPCTGVRVRRV